MSKQLTQPTSSLTLEQIQIDISNVRDHVFLIREHGDEEMREVQDLLGKARSIVRARLSDSEMGV